MFSDLLTVARARGYVAALVTTACTGLLILVLPIEVKPVIGRTGVFNHLWPVALALAGIAPLAVARARGSVYERCAPHRAKRAWMDAAVVTGALVLGSALASAGVLGFGETLPRMLFYVCLAAGAYPWAGAAAWLPGVGYALLSWLLGTDNRGATRAWAITLNDSPVAVTWTVDLVLIVGIILVAVGTRGRS